MYSTLAIYVTFAVQEFEDLSSKLVDRDASLRAHI